MKIEAILFDFDGVLAETMEDLFLSWNNSFSRFGIQVKREDYFPLEGTNVFEIAKIISKKYDLNAQPEEIVRLKNEFYMKNHSFSFYPGVNELVDKLYDKRIKMGIVSASPMEKLERTVPREFLKKFSVVISGGDTSKGKPDPEPYLIAAKRVGVKSQECIVVENAPLGVKAAKSAGMYCIAITSTNKKEILKEADSIIERFEKLKDLDIIKKLL